MMAYKEEDMEINKEVMELDGGALEINVEIMPLNGGALEMNMEIMELNGGTLEINVEIMELNGEIKAKVMEPNGEARAAVGKAGKGRPGVGNGLPTGRRNVAKENATARKGGKVGGWVNSVWVQQHQCHFDNR